MKKVILTIFIMTSAFLSFSQSYTWISSYYYSYIEICVEFQRAAPVSSFSYADVLAYKEAQYENAWKQVSAVYGQMDKLQLLNKTNRTYLNNYRDKYFKQIAATAGQIDLSINQNKNWAIDNFRKPVTSNKHIRNEIKILNKFGEEIDFIEHQAYKFSKEQLGDIESEKKNIAGFLEEYENADPSNTQSLLKKYNLYLMMISVFLEY